MNLKIKYVHSIAKKRKFSVSTHTTQAVRFPNDESHSILREAIIFFSPSLNSRHKNIQLCKRFYVVHSTNGNKFDWRLEMDTNNRQAHAHKHTLNES